MADVTISSLTLAPTVSSTMALPITNDSLTFKATVSQLRGATVSTVAGPPSNSTGNDGDVYYQV